MKKFIFSLAFVASMCMMSCGNSTSVASDDADSTSVDTTVVDTLVSDTACIE